MRHTNEFRQQFEFTYNKRNVKVLFLIDIEPYIICFSAKLRQLYFEVSLTKGFTLDTFLDKATYYRLREMFEINDTKTGLFKTADFFKAFNTRIPQSINDTSKVRPDDLWYKRKDVEESDKIFFWRFRLNASNEHVSCQNLKKTEILLGKDARNMCEKHNISTQWTDVSKIDDFDDWKKSLDQRLQENRI